MEQHGRVQVLDGVKAGEKVVTERQLHPQIRDAERRTGGGLTMINRDSQILRPPAHAGLSRRRSSSPASACWRWQQHSDRRLSRCDQRAGAGARHRRRHVAAGGGKARHAPDRDRDGRACRADGSALGFQNRPERDHRRFRGRRERLFRPPAGLRAAAERARRICPPGVDVELGPISTGLGEIFQYTLVSKDPKYDATELRTIQDYIVRPILRTVPGRDGREFVSADW